MIIRVFEGSLRTGREHEFMVSERELLARRDVDGLLGVSIGRRLAGDQTHVITLSIWRDRESIEQFEERNPEGPVFLTGGEDLVETWSLEHYEGLDEADPVLVGAIT